MGNRPRESQIEHSSPVVDRFGHSAGIENAWLGGHCFMVLGGPSLNKLPTERLRERGIITFAVNNVGAHVRPHIWTYGDTSAKFHSSIWLDAGILKLVPFPKMQNTLQEQVGGRFQYTARRVCDMPGVFGVRRNNCFRPATFLYENTVNWGHNKKYETDEETRIGHHVLSTMFQAVRLSYFLGFRHLYLLGADFTMAVGYRYAFQETDDAGSARGNNNSYIAINAMFHLVAPYFTEAGFHVWNCNPDSNLTAFPHKPFEECIAAAQAGIEQQPNTVGWYDSVKNKGKQAEPVAAGQPENEQPMMEEDKDE